MYKKIMVPVDLAHTDRIGKALESAADLAKHYGIPVCYVGVTPETPSSVAHNPQEYAQKLDQFAAEQAKKYGIGIESRAMLSHDPAVDLDDTLIKAIEEVGADLVVMASHVPGFPDHIFSSNAGAVATHAAVSVFVIR
jgi:nucleotide-binding universal stress UspA family protein